MNRYLVGILTLVLVSAGGIFLATQLPEASSPERPSSSQKEEAPVVAVAPPLPEETAPQIASAQIKPDPLLQAPDEAKPLPVSPNTPAKPISAKSPSPYAQIIIPAGQPVPELFPYQTERDEIGRLASTYDTKQIPAIAAFLGHKDASVREAARQGLIQLGEEKAVPVLKEAAKKAPTPEEAALLTEAAEFLALPSFVDVVFPNQRTSKS